MKKSLKKRTFKICLTLSLVLGLCLGFNSQSLFSKTKDFQYAGKITCHSSSTKSNAHTYTRCVGCVVVDGQGSDAGKCRS